MSGHIRERSGNLEIRVFAGCDPLTGKRQYMTKTVRGGKREAQKVPAAMVFEIGSGKRPKTASTVGSSSTPGSRRRTQASRRDREGDEGLHRSASPTRSRGRSVAQAADE